MKTIRSILQEAESLAVDVYMDQTNLMVHGLGDVAGRRASGRRSSAGAKWIGSTVLNGHRTIVRGTKRNILDWALSAVVDGAEASSNCETVSRKPVLIDDSGRAV